MLGYVLCSIGVGMCPNPLVRSRTCPYAQDWDLGSVRRGLFICSSNLSKTAPSSPR